MAFEYIIAALFGLIFGSFLNVCIYRIPRKTFLNNTRSYCTDCKSTIAWYDNFPVLSFLILRGRCRSCKKAISIQYPVVEILMAVVFVFWYHRFPFFEFGFYPPRLGLRSFLELPRFFHAVLLNFFLVFVIWVDGQFRIIPRNWCVFFLVLLPPVVFLHPELDGFSSAVGALTGGASIYLIAWSYYLLRKRIGIGFGDVWLMAVIGGWLGYQHVFSVLFLGSLLALFYALFSMLFRKSQRRLDLELAFGPFLSVAAMIILAFDREYFSFWTL